MADRVKWPTWIGVVVEDLDRQAEFYRTVLGFRQTEATEDWVNFDVGGNVFELIRRDALPQYNAQRYQVGFTVDDIEAARADLLDAGVVALSEIEGDPDTANRWAYFKDPEGNVFELTQWIR